MKPGQKFIISFLFFIPFFFMQFIVLAQDTIPSDTVVIVNDDTVDIVIIEPDLTLQDELPFETIATVNQDTLIKQKFFYGL